MSDDSDLVAHLRGSEPDLGSRLCFPQPPIPESSDVLLSATNVGDMASLPSLKMYAHDVKQRRVLVNQFGGVTLDSEEGSLNRSFDSGIIVSLADTVTDGEIENTADDKHLTLLPRSNN